MKNQIWTLVLSTSLMGCHGKLQHAAANLGPIEPIVTTSGGSWVHLGTAPEESGVVGDVLTLIQVPKAVKISQRIEHALKNQRHQQVLQNSLQATLGDNASFGTTEHTGATLRVDVLSYGMHADSIGQAGVFTYTTRTRLFDHQGQKIYQKRHFCTTKLREMIETNRPNGPVNHAREFARLSDVEIAAIYNEMAHSCGEQIVQQMFPHTESNVSN